MITRTVRAASSALLIMSAAPAGAADLYGNGMKDIGYDASIAAGPSWYARIDGGYAVHGDPDITEFGIYDLVDETVDDTWTLGGGIGYYFTATVRGDITYDHRFDADTSATLLAHPAGLDGARRFGIESDVVLFNLYYDFNRSGRFNPYVGAGLGFTFNRTATGTATSTCLCTGAILEGEETDLAGAIMAGFTAKLRGGQTAVGGSSKDAPMMVETGRNLYLDVGYRYLYLGDVSTGPIVTTVPIVENATVEDLTAHEFRVGLRYDLR